MIKEQNMPNQWTKAKETGIPYILSDASRKKMSVASTKENYKRFSDEGFVTKFKESMRNAVLNNPDSYTSSNVCGRVKIHEYNGEKFHGKWEVEVAKWLDRNNIKWDRKSIKPFSYFWKNGWHLYYPDFYLIDYDKYIEVKGYETERDRCKWAVVPNLIVLKKKEISLIMENKFGLEAHLV